MSGISRRSLHDIAERLSPRDWAILRFLSAHRFASTTQLRRTSFTTHATTGAATRATLRVLDRLLEHRLVTRLDRRVGGVRQGSSGFIWHLDVAGERLTRQKDAPRRHVGGDLSTAFVDHTLAVTETVVALHESTQETGLRLSTVLVETAAWRSYLNRHGVATILKPDLFVTLSTPEYDDHWYIEVDRGTEHLPVLLQKCRAYTAYKATGRAQAEHGVFPRVLWIVPTPRRVDRLTGAIRSDPLLPTRLFTVITPGQLAAAINPLEDTNSSSPRKEES